MGKIKICIDPGHGGADSGAINPFAKLKESQVALAVALKLEQLLKSAGHKVVLTRRHIVFKPLWYRAWIANRANADLFVSIHCNGAHNTKVSGIETFKYTASRSAHKWRGKIHKALIRNFPLNKNRGVKSANYSVLRKTKMPAVLVGLSFNSNLKSKSEISPMCFYLFLLF